MTQGPSLEHLPASTIELLARLRDHKSTIRAMTYAQLLGKDGADHPDAALVSRLFLAAQPYFQFVGTIVGADNRVETRTLTRPGQIAAANATAAVFAADRVTIEANPERPPVARLHTRKHGFRRNLCPDQKFFHQQAGAGATAVLVAPNLVVTAAHVLFRLGHVTSLQFVFGFRILEDGSSATEVEQSEVYAGRKVVGMHYDERTGADWAVIEINDVVGHAPVQIRRTRAAVQPTPIYIVGHPNGLPAKFADGAVMRPGRTDGDFYADLDATIQNSGSPVFSAEDDVVEGIYVNTYSEQDREEPEFVTKDCNVVRIIPQWRLTDQRCVRTVCFEHLIP